MSKQGPSVVPKYNEGLKAAIVTDVGSSPRARVHRTEWAKVVAGLPVEVRRAFPHRRWNSV